jgi:hypothetical protein
MTTLDITLSQEDWVRLMDLLYELPVSDLNEKIMSQLIDQCDDLSFGEKYG